MYTVFKDFSFSAAHQVRGHTGGCQNLHGHNYRVRVHVSAQQLDPLGMVLDFSELKAAVSEIAGPFDHSVINDHPPFDKINPTAELLSGYIFEQLELRLAAGELGGARVRLRRVDVWESDSSCASFEAATP
ncbi:MAG: 6-carboxytetrahydropterin synthase QueD [Deltaproteobacteria bacterium]|nr:6-carboxytetrahydropterin synthase QueD [Deltaproteobacteria bacterium]